VHLLVPPYPQKLHLMGFIAIHPRADIHYIGMIDVKALGIVEWVRVLVGMISIGKDHDVVV